MLVALHYLLCRDAAGLGALLASRSRVFKAGERLGSAVDEQHNTQ
jgi:hypothetical protein